MQNRLTWDEYFMQLSWLAAQRSTCRRHHVGAVIVKDRRILSTGYNGAPRGLKDCLELGCLRDALGIASGTRHEICRAVHAEQNAIIQCARAGVILDGATLYCTHSPCNLCAKMIVNAGIERVVASEVYPDSNYADLFSEAGIEFSIQKVPTLTISQKK